MSAQRGRDILLKIFDADQNAFVTVAGLRTRKISLNAQAVDVTDGDSLGRWRELLSGAGVRRASLSGSGVFRDQVSDEKIRAAFFNGTVENWEVILPDFGSLTGEFYITALEYAGNHDGEMSFDMALESAGPVTFGAL